MFEERRWEIWSDHTWKRFHEHEVTTYSQGANAHIVEVVGSNTVHENIVGSMYVETLLDFCIRC